MSGQISNADKYVTRLVLVVMIVFLICYTPVVGSSVLWTLLGKKIGGVRRYHILLSRHRSSFDRAKFPCELHHLCYI